MKKLLSLLVALLILTLSASFSFADEKVEVQEEIHSYSLLIDPPFYE
ncbi:hypothetical protein [Fusibacter sp. JL216-2]